MKIRAAFSFGLLNLVALLPALTTRVVSAAGDGPYLEVTIVTGEHSKDSNSTTRTLTVANRDLIYKEAYAGARSGQRSPVERKFKLTKQDKSDLTALLELRTGSQLTNKTIPQDSSRYFRVTIVSALHRPGNTITIDASPNDLDLKKDPVYQASVLLIERLYQIINRTEPNLTAPTLIN